MNMKREDMARDKGEKLRSVVIEVQDVTYIKIEGQTGTDNEAVNKALLKLECVIQLKEH